MRSHLGLLTVMGLFLGAAHASEGSVPWSQLELAPARQDAPALGPDRVAAGPDGQVLIWNPASGWLDAYDSVAAFQDGELRASVRLAAVDDLLWTDAGLVVLDAAARRVSLYSVDGQRLDSRGLPELVPPGCGLGVQGDGLVAVDAFGNRHGVARLSAGRLAPWTGPRLQEPAVAVRWDPGAGQLRVDGRGVAVPAALKTSGRALQGGGRTWLVVEQVVADGPIQVRREAISMDTGVRYDLSPRGRLYAPSSDLSVSGRGDLVWMKPGPSGVTLVELSP